MKLCTGLLVWCLALVLPAAAAAAPPVPEGPVLLTVSGRITAPNTADGTARFDRAGLEALGTSTLRTRTPWTEGRPVFEGVLLRDVLEAVGAAGTSLAATAANAYTVTIPVRDAERYDVLLALRQDGRRLTLRDRGPLWVVYPRDRHPELRDDVHNGKWIWQLVTLDVR
jgi:hypothetical protein